MPTKIAIVAGEASGDLIASKLMRHLKREFPEVEFIGVGGPLMCAAGLQVMFPYQRLSLHGFGWDVWKQVPGLLWQRRKLARAMVAQKPKLFIGVDAPDFNLALEAYIKCQGIPTIHYVSPSIWAWRKGRIAKIVRSVGHLLTLFPFEAAYYQDRPIKVDYVGHPLADSFPMHIDTAQAKTALGLDPEQTVIAMLPGSRISEVTQLADIMLATALKMSLKQSNLIFLVPLVNAETKQLFEQTMYQHYAEQVQWPHIQIMFGHADLAMQAADVVLVASGTATLEAALLKKPMVITYKVSRLSWFILKRLSYGPYVGLPNILCGKSIVPELLQNDAQPEKLAQALTQLLDDEDRRQDIASTFTQLHQTLRQGTDLKVSAIVAQYLQ